MFVRYVAIRPDVEEVFSDALSGAEDSSAEVMDDASERRQVVLHSPSEPHISTTTDIDNGAAAEPGVVAVNVESESEAVSIPAQPEHGDSQSERAQTEVTASVEINPEVDATLDVLEKAIQNTADAAEEDGPVPEKAESGQDEVDGSPVLSHIDAPEPSIVGENIKVLASLQARETAELTDKVRDQSVDGAPPKEVDTEAPVNDTQIDKEDHGAESNLPDKAIEYQEQDADNLDVEIKSKPDALDSQDMMQANLTDVTQETKSDTKNYVESLPETVASKTEAGTDHVETIVSVAESDAEGHHETSLDSALWGTESDRESHNETSLDTVVPETEPDMDCNAKTLTPETKEEQKLDILAQKSTSETAETEKGVLTEATKVLSCEVSENECDNEEFTAEPQHAAAGFQNDSASEEKKSGLKNDTVDTQDHKPNIDDTPEIQSQECIDFQTDVKETPGDEEVKEATLDVSETSAAMQKKTVDIHEVEQEVHKSVDETDTKDINPVAQESDVDEDPKGDQPPDKQNKCDQSKTTLVAQKDISTNDDRAQTDTQLTDEAKEKTENDSSESLGKIAVEIESGVRPNSSSNDPNTSHNETASDDLPVSSDEKNVKPPGEPAKAEQPTVKHLRESQCFGEPSPAKRRRIMSDDEPILSSQVRASN